MLFSLIIADVLLIPKTIVTKEHKVLRSYSNPSNTIQYLWWCIECCIQMMMMMKVDGDMTWQRWKETSCFKLTSCFVEQTKLLKTVQCKVLHLLKCWDSVAVDGERRPSDDYYFTGQMIKMYNCVKKKC